MKVGSPAPFTRPRRLVEFQHDRWELFTSQRAAASATTGRRASGAQGAVDEAVSTTGCHWPLNLLETTRSHGLPGVSERASYVYYPDCADVGIGALDQIRGRSFAVLADVTIDITGAGACCGGAGGHAAVVKIPAACTVLTSSVGAAAGHHRVDPVRRDIYSRFVFADPERAATVTRRWAILESCSSTRTGRRPDNMAQLTHLERSGWQRRRQRATRQFIPATTAPFAFAERRHRGILRRRVGATVRDVSPILRLLSRD